MKSIWGRLFEIVLMIFCFTGIVHADQFCLSQKNVVAEVNGQKIPLEPSGIVYDPEHQIYVAVSDNYNDFLALKAENYVIFWFKKDEKNQIIAHPLLTREQSKKFLPFDLEAITRLKNKKFIAFSSLSLHSHKRSRDDLYRFQAYEFSIKKINENEYVAENMNWLAKRLNGYWREWLIFQKEIPWSTENIVARSDTKEGINLEGMTSTNQSDHILLGFRSPLFYDAQKKLWNAMLLDVKLPADDKQFPILHKIYYLPNQHGLKHGIRSISQIPEYSDWYFVIFGPSGNNITNFEYFLWNIKTQQIMKRTTFPESKNIVWEGVTVKTLKNSLGKEVLQVNLIDDFQACFKTIEIPVDF
jgi:hypothetical protein